MQHKRDNESKGNPDGKYHAQGAEVRWQPPRTDDSPSASEGRANNCAYVCVAHSLLPFSSAGIGRVFVAQGGHLH